MSRRISIAAILVLAFSAVFFVKEVMASPDHHVTKIEINKPYEQAWEWVSNPSNFSKLYPHWVKSISQIGDDEFEVTMPNDYKHTMVQIKNKELGTIDFDINPGETSRSRLIPLSESKTLHIHIAVKGNQPDELFKIISENTDNDYLNAKKVIEAAP